MEMERVETERDIGVGTPALVTKWKNALSRADKEEKDWREDAASALKRYRGGEKSGDVRKDASKHNILWSNVETFKPALYNTLPKPDIRRRFKDADPLGKFVAELLERAVSFTLEAYDFESTVQCILNDYLLPCRSIDRVRYIPDIQTDGAGQEVGINYQSVECEHVEYDRFRRGPGRKWEDVQWVAFEHKLTRKELVEKFGEIGQEIPLDSDGRGNDKNEPDESDIYLRATVWEIWDKESKRVIYINTGYAKAPLKIEDAPLGLRGFFPIPRPLYRINTTGKDALIPVVEYELYRAQADELDAITERISRLVKALKFRGVYDATIAELSTLLQGGDNDFIPAQNVTHLLERGGLEKAIWTLPIETIANVIAALYQQREQIKQTIYEITGLSDILRGASDSNETARAQEIKSQYGGLRLQRSQRELQRYLRDIIRIKAELIAENYTPEILMQMTGMKMALPDEVARAQFAVQMSKMRGMEPPPEAQEILALPPADEVMKVLRSDVLRNYRIDIETDSTIATDEQADKEAISELFNSIGGYVSGIAPAVQGGFIGVDAAKQIMMSGIRRFRLGREIEDAIEQDEERPVGPEAAQMQEQMQQAQEEMAQAQEQVNKEAERVKSEQMAVDKAKVELKTQQDALKLKEQMADQELQHEAEMIRMRQEMDAEKALHKVEQVVQGFLDHMAQADQARQAESQRVEQDEAKRAESEQQAQASAQEREAMTQAVMTAVQEAVRAITAPKRVVRDESGRVAGVETVEAE